MKTLAIIPARSGSQSVPDKNIAKIGAYPMLCYQLMIAQKSLELGLIDDFMISTDSYAYLELLSAYGFNESYLRPAELAQNLSPTIDAVKHALEYKAKSGQQFDSVLLLQPTSPFNRLIDVINALELLKITEQATCVATVTKLADHHPLRIKFMDDTCKLRDISSNFIELETMRRQDFEPTAYIRTGAVYLSRIETIQSFNGLRGDSMYGVEVPSIHAINVDEPVDLMLARSIIDSNMINFDIDCLGVK